MIRKLVRKDIWGRSLWIDLIKWAKGVKLLASNMNALTKVTSAEKEFNNQLDRMTLPVSSQTLFLDIYVTVQWEQEQSHYSDRDSC